MYSRVSSSSSSSGGSSGTVVIICGTGRGGCGGWKEVSQFHRAKSIFLLYCSMCTYINCYTKMQSETQLAFFS